MLFPASLSVNEIAFPWGPPPEGLKVLHERSWNKPYKAMAGHRRLIFAMNGGMHVGWEVCAMWQS